jgi:hypothetical protein
MNLENAVGNNRTLHGGSGGPGGPRRKPSNKITALVAFEMKEFIEGQKTEQDIQDKDSRIYRIIARILEFHLITDKS